jgi:iron complex outermembrane receptor protein
VSYSSNFRLVCAAWIVGWGLNSASAQGVQSAAGAAPGASPSEGLEEIVVTANKRAESIRDVPNSILAMTNESLERANVQNFDDLVRLAPSVTITKTTQPANNSINIRGIGTYSFSVATQPSTAVIVDDIPQAFQAEAFTALTNVQQVEVLRGPQSTLFGKSATAGVINITTLGPSDTFSAKAEAGATTDRDEHVQASVSGPITDSLKFRLSGNYSNYRGNLNNIATGHWQDGDINQSWRGNLTWAPSEAWTVILLPYVLSDHASCCAQANTFVSPGVTFSKSKLPASLILQGATPSPDNINVATSVDATGDSYDIGSGLKVVRNFDGGLTLANIASYDHYTLHDNQSTDETDFNFATITPGAPPGGSGNGGYFTVNSITEELRLTSPSAGSLRYVTGLYFSKSDSKRDFVRGSDSLGTFGTNSAGAVNQSLPTTNSTQYSSYLDHSDIKTSAAYGQASLDVTKQWTLVGGLRLHHEDVSYNFLDRFHDITLGIPDCSTVNPYSKINPATTLEAHTCNNSTNLLGKAAIQFHFTPDLMVFADFAQGFKGLAYDLTSTLALQTPIASGPNKGIPTGDVVAAHQPIPPEKSSDYEVGFKGEFFERRVTWNLTGFYEEFIGFQAQNRDTLTGQNVLESIGKVTSQGVESEFATRPVPELTLTLNGAFDIAKMVDFPTGPCYAGQTVALGCVNGTQNLNGKPLPNAPKGTIDANANYEIPLGGELSVFLDVGYRWQSQVIFALAQDPYSVQPSYGIFNFSSSLAAKHWKLTLFCSNVFDKQYAINRGTATQFNISPYAAPFTTATFWTPGRDAFRYGGIKVAASF